ncbi:hypothetical protein D9M68_796890 [compost metagenome]
MVKRFHGEIFGQALCHVEHVDRDQTFLDLSTRTTESSYVYRVDRVDTVLDKGAFTPADHLLAQANRTRLIGDGVVVINEGVENLCAGCLRTLFTIVVVNVLEQTALIFQFEVVPVLAAYENTGIAVLQFKVVDAFENLREGLTLLEIQVAIVRSLR